MAKHKKTSVEPLEEKVVDKVAEEVAVDLSELALPEGEILPEPDEDTEPEVQEDIKPALRFTAKFFLVNPYTLARFGPGLCTEIDEIDSWTSSQIEAKLLRPC